MSKFKWQLLLQNLKPFRASTLHYTSQLNSNQTRFSMFSRYEIIRFFPMIICKNQCLQTSLTQDLHMLRERIRSTMQTIEENILKVVWIQLM